MTDPDVLVITGASDGIGAALARCYASPGRLLAICGRDAARLDAVAAWCRNRGAEVETALFDVTDADATARFLALIHAIRPIELVIANAGITAAVGPEGEPEDEAQIRRTFAVNLHGVLNTVLPAVDLMRPRKSGQIAVIGSLAAWRGLPYCPSYSASKAAVEAYAQGLRGALARDGIAVSVVSPGYVATAMTSRIEGPKPLIVSADRAARLIRRGLARNRARITFPFPLTLGVRLLSILPDWAAAHVMPAFRFHLRRAEDIAPGPDLR